MEERIREIIRDNITLVHQYTGQRLEANVTGLDVTVKKILQELSKGMMGDEEIKKQINKIFDGSYTKGSPDYPKLIVFQRQKALNELLLLFQAQRIRDQAEMKELRDELEATYEAYFVACEFLEAERAEQVEEIFLEIEGHSIKQPWASSQLNLLKFMDWYHNLKSKYIKGGK